MLDYLQLSPEQLNLLKAIRENDFKQVKKLVVEGVDPNFTTDNILEYSPAYVAGLNDNLDILRYLIDDVGIEIDKEMAAYFSLCGSFSAGAFVGRRLMGEKEV